MLLKMLFLFFSFICSLISLEVHLYLGEGWGGVGEGTFTFINSTLEICDSQNLTKLKGWVESPLLILVLKYQRRKLKGF